MPKKMQELIAEKLAEMQASQAETGEAPDPVLQDTAFLGGSMSESQETIEKLEAEAEERDLDAAGTSKAEREKDERIAKLEAELEVARRRWLFADYKDLPVNFPFEITIQPTPGAGGNQPAEPNLNGHVYTIPRGLPVHVPKAVLEILDGSKYAQWEKVLNPRTSEAVGGENSGGVKHVRVEYHRYPYSARPLYHLADVMKKWPGIDMVANGLEGVSA